MLAAGLLLFGLLSCALGRPTAHDTLHVHERRAEVPEGFTYVGKAEPSAMLDLRIALVQGDSSGLEAALYDVSNPDSANYRKHLSKAEVRSDPYNTSLDFRCRIASSLVWTGGRARRPEAGERTGGEDVVVEEQHLDGDGLPCGRLAEHPGPGGSGERFAGRAVQRVHA